MTLKNTTQPITNSRYLRNFVTHTHTRVTVFPSVARMQFGRNNEGAVVTASSEAKEEEEEEENKDLGWLSQFDDEVMSARWMTRDNIVQIRAELDALDRQRRNYVKEPCPKHINLSEPEKWFPETRLMQRRILYHYGPTNSGKTHHALERLKQKVKQGKKCIYCAPLRLLAWEVFERLNTWAQEEGLPYKCNLMTGIGAC